MEESELARLRDEVQALRQELECLKESFRRGFMQAVKGIERASSQSQHEVVPAGGTRRIEDQ